MASDQRSCVIFGVDGSLASLRAMRELFAGSVPLSSFQAMRLVKSDHRVRAGCPAWRSFWARSCSGGCEPLKNSRWMQSSSALPSGSASRTAEDDLDLQSPGSYQLVGRSFR
jgi:hypothetical protein